MAAVAIALASLACAGCGSNTTPPAVLTSIDVTPSMPSIALGSSQQFHATGTYSDGSTQDLTSSVTWNSTPIGIATVGSTGMANGTHSGSTTIAATAGRVSGSTMLTVEAGVVKAADMTVERASHTATLLNDGTVLIAGGASGAAGVLASAEIYNPTAGTFALTGSMNAARKNHTATLLYNGMVLIAGGLGAGGSPLASAELYNPVTGAFTFTGNMSSARENHTAALMFNDLALVAGGDNGSAALATAELYDPSTGTFSPTGSMTVARASHTETLLNGGKILITGGSTGSNGTALASAELYDPTAGTFAAAGSMITARYYQTATLLNNGSVLVSGGQNAGGILASQELYDPNAATFTAAASMNAPRDPFTATLLNTGSVLIAGGQSSGGTILRLVDIFEPITLEIANLVGISVNPGLSTTVPGGIQQYAAEGLFSNGASEALASVSWSSSNTSVATIGRTGAALGTFAGAAPQMGQTVITASAGSVTSGQAYLSVAQPQCLFVAPSTASIAPRTTTQFSAYGYIGGVGVCAGVAGTPTIVDVTAIAAWTSSSPGVATTSAGGVVTGVGAGTTTVEALFGGAGNKSTLTVSPVVSIALDPANLSELLPNQGLAFKVAAFTLADGVTQTSPSTNAINTWTSSSPGVATVSSAGVLTPVGPGTTMIQMSYDGVVGSTTLTIPSLVSVAVAPPNILALQGNTRQLTATGIFSDGETRDYSSIASWTSSPPGVVTLGPTGLATVVGPGPATIQAVVAISIESTIVPAVSGSTTFTGTNAGFVSTGSPNVARYAHTATLLNNGMMLITGGADSGGIALSSAELYDPATGKFTPTGSMTTARAGHAATLLNNGMVLITGGTSYFGSGLGAIDTLGDGNFYFLDTLSSAELYDPSTGTFTVTGNMGESRFGHTATLLGNGQVLIAGGTLVDCQLPASDTPGCSEAPAFFALSEAEIYNPANGKFTATVGNMTSARAGHTATLLNDGEVLLAGGNSILNNNGGPGLSGKVVSTAEIFDPRTGIFIQTGGMSGARQFHTATLLDNGTVLVAGGDDFIFANGGASGKPLSTAEIYNPAVGTFAVTGSMSGARHLHAAALLSNGGVLIEGGDFSGALATAEVYDPIASIFSPTGGLQAAREQHTATLLNNGTVLVAGGANFTNGYTVMGAEFYKPATFTPAGLVSIAVTPANDTIPLGSLQSLTATGTFSGGATEQLASVTWASSSNAVATVSNDTGDTAAVVGTGAGLTTVTASAGSVIGSTTVTVTSGSTPTLTSIAVTPVNHSINLGSTQQFTATGTYSDASTKNLTSTATWTSSSTSVATIGDSGLATSVGTGSTTIQAAVGGIAGSTTLTVTSAPAPTLTSIAVTPVNPSIALGGTQQFTATGSYSDASTKNLTNTATWTSSSTSVAAISSAGLAISAAQGATTIQAVLSGISGSTTLTVTAGGSSATYTIGGTLVNLRGGSDGVQLQDNGGDLEMVTANGSFTFPTAVVSGSAYTVRVALQPNDPTQICVVSNGTGTATANVTSVLVDCGGNSNEWAWMNGADVFGQAGAYGTQGTASSSNVPGARNHAVSWIDASGNFWLFGGLGYDSAGSVNDNLNDLWEYSLGQWSWMGGSNTAGHKGVYGTQGTPAAGNVPGARNSAISWIDAAGNFWLFGGNGYDSAGTQGALNDLWEYSAGNWTWVSGSNAVGEKGTYGTEGTAAAGNVPGARSGSVSWIDAAGNLWLFGGLGLDSAGNSGSLNDLWKYTASTHQWTWLSGATVINQSGNYGSQGTAAAGNVPGGRSLSVKWTDAAGNFWLMGASSGFDSTGHAGFLNDLWRYNPGTSQWTWVSGSNLINQIGTYGVEDTFAPNDVPGARGEAVTWTDAAGNLWLFGGNGYDSNGAQGNLSDLWEFSAGQWTWMGGSAVRGASGQPVQYGQSGTIAPGQAPGARKDAVGWMDGNGNLWLFGGSGYDSVGNLGSLNDQWEYQP